LLARYMQNCAMSTYRVSFNQYQRPYLEQPIEKDKLLIKKYMVFDFRLDENQQLK